MNDIEKLKAKINIALYRQRNGAVVDTMARMSGDASRSYGVSLTDIRRIAERYAPCQPLADMLYAGEVRDHRLAAIYIADPDSFDSDKTVRWMRQVRTAELADCAAQALFCKIPGIVSMVMPLVTEEPLVSHAAVMTMARAFRERLSDDAEKASNAVAELLSAISRIKGRTDSLTLSAFTFMLDLLGRAGYVREVSEFVDTLPDVSREELGWLKG